MCAARLCRVFCHPRTANVKAGILRIHRRGAEDAEIGGPRDLIRKAESRKGISEIEGKVARVAASEGGSRTSFKRSALFPDFSSLIQRSESVKIRAIRGRIDWRPPRRTPLQHSCPFVSIRG
jgi:hypothetical protein